LLRTGGACRERERKEKKKGKNRRGKKKKKKKGKSDFSLLFLSVETHRRPTNKKHCRRLTFAAKREECEGTYLPLIFVFWFSLWKFVSLRPDVWIGKFAVVQNKNKT
jgi:hypothetical protein